jgi:hypothetical protein
MAFWSISDNKAVTTAGGVNGLPSGVDNDQGSIRFAGNIGETTKFTNVALGEGNPIVTVVSGVSWIDPANGTLPVSSFNNLGSGVIVRVTDKIAGASNTTLLGGDSNSAANPPIHQVDVIETKLYKTAVRNGQWNPVNGAFSPAVSVVESGGWNISAGVDNSSDLIGSGTDDAANPTQDVPGELVYNYGSGADPTQDEYEAKTNW